MKRILAVLSALLICLCIFTACGKNKKTVEDETVIAPEDIIKPTEAPELGTVRTEDDLFGSFDSGDYTATLEAGENGTVVFTIKDKAVDNKSHEWVIKGYFGNENNVVNYINAVKYEITYDRTGAEKNREALYENGTGRMVFDGRDSFVWKNSFETLDGKNEFTRV